MGAFSAAAPPEPGTELPFRPRQELPSTTARKRARLSAPKVREEARIPPSPPCCPRREVAEAKGQFRRRHWLCERLDRVLVVSSPTVTAEEETEGEMLSPAPHTRSQARDWLPNTMGLSIRWLSRPSTALRVRGHALPYPAP